MCQRKAQFLTKKESEREWCRQLVELGRAAGENAEKTRTVNDIRADGRPHRRYGYFFSAHERVHVRDREDKLVEPCQLGWENAVVARMRDLSAVFSLSPVKTRF